MHYDDDDLPIGSILSRREAVRLLAVTGAAVFVGCRPNAAASSVAGTDSAVRAAGAASAAIPGCVVKPELTLGPYFLDRQLNRSDVRTDPSSRAVSEGASLVLAFNVQQIANGQCSPLADAMVDIWQCDAAGVYSGVSDNVVGFNTVNQQFLRGYQVTDAGGIARFTTIYPGWYQGRAVHIHFKIRTPASAVAAGQTASVYDFTSQLFFDDTLSDRVHAQAPYVSKGQRDRRNQNDGIYRRAGDTLLLSTVSAGSGYEATFAIALDLSDAATGRPDDMRRSLGGPPGARPN